jgi:8-oxo-dGTP pyrophosphatase MutT (NUDIX family)
VTAPDVRAAGGIPWRIRDEGLEVLVLHRPRYDDWSFPKGKADKSETDEACALRETLEETGLAVRLGLELASTEYSDRRGRSKLVRYWEMDLIDDDQAADAESFEPNDEVDEIRWVSMLSAVEVLSYPRDVEVLMSFAEVMASGETPDRG